jgi:hypothetical protein
MTFSVSDETLFVQLLSFKAWLSSMFLTREKVYKENNEKNEVYDIKVEVTGKGCR